jgi:glycosyltransferase involved in cell wall biosynthesis
MAPRRIVHVISGLLTGGAEMMLYKLLSATDRSRWEPWVVSLTNKGTMGERIESLGVNLITAGMSRGYPNPLLGLRCAFKINRLQPLILQSWMYHADILGALAEMIGGQSSLVWSVRDDIHPSMSRVTLATVRSCASLSRVYPDVILFNSYTSLSHHKRLGYAPDRLRVIPNGFDTSVFSPDLSVRSRVRRELNIPDDETLIAMFARFMPGKKDHESFIRAAGLLCKDRPKVRFLLCGQGATLENPFIERWVRESGVAARFVFLGERSDVATLVKAVDVGTLLSYFEGFPNVLGEMMSTGIPCVATDVGDCRRIVNTFGTIVPPGDYESVAAAWRSILDLPPERRIKLGEEARTFIVRNYSLRAVAEQYGQLHEELLDARAARMRNVLKQQVAST